MKNLTGCLLALIGLPLAAVILYLLAVAVYFLFNLFLYFLPVLLLAAGIILLPYLAYQFLKGFNS